MNAYTKAYLAGLIDGDGSIMLQLKPRTRSRFGIRVKSIVVIYQDSKMKNEMQWLHQELGAGYLYIRNDHIAEIRIEGHTRVKELLVKLVPYLRFKKQQATLTIQAIDLMSQGIKSKEQLLSVSAIADQISSYNYKSSKRKYTSEYVMHLLSP